MLTLKTKNLNVRYMDCNVLKDINITLEAGRSYAIIGPSGEGKSTLLKSLDGLLDNRNATITGEILLNDIIVRDFNTLRQKEITYLLQDPSNQFNPVYTIGEQLDRAQKYSPSFCKEERKERTLKALALMNLDKHVYHLYPNQLSGGMLQRANIAIAFLQDKNILLLDEPTQGLDFKLENELIEILINRKDKKNKITVFVTHSLSIAKKADYIFFLYDGSILEEGKPGDLFDDPQTDFLKKMLEASFYVKGN